MDFRIFILKVLSFAALLVERLSLALWRTVFWAVFVMALWLFEIPQMAGTWFAVAFSVVSIAVGFALLVMGLRGFRWPNRYVVLRRIETDSHAPHRPLSTFDDVPVDGHVNALWVREVERRRQGFKNLKASPPKPFIAQVDPHGIRLFILIAFVSGVLVAGGDWRMRVRQGLLPMDMPQFTRTARQSDINFWIDAPPYTNLERLVPSNNDKPLSIAQGSIAKIIVPPSFVHTLHKPYLEIDDVRHDLKKAQSGEYVLDLSIPDGQEIVLNHGLFGSIRWPYSIVTDDAPKIEVGSEIVVLADAQLKFLVKMRDDYGVEKMDMRMTIAPSVVPPPLVGWPLIEQRVVLSPAGQDFEAPFIYDLAAHPWAGSQVVFVFTAYDHLGQIAQSTPLTAILPERNFTHPAAQALIALRKELLVAPFDNYREYADGLQSILYRPHLYKNDQRVFLALRVAASRFYHNEPSIKVAESAAALLWDIALRLEDGDLSFAARDLRNLQNALQNALSDPNTSDQEIAALMQEMREAMAEYMQAMAREMQKRIESGEIKMPELSPEALKAMAENVMSADELAEMLDKMQADMMSGDRASAQAMLAQMQRMMEQTQAGLSQGMSGEMPEDMKMMMEGLEALKDLIAAQKDLRDVTAEQAEVLKMLHELGIDTSDDLPAPFINMSEENLAQQALRDQLGDLMLKADAALKKIPENMGLADISMKDALKALEGNDPVVAFNAQEQAIAHLEDAQQNMQQQMQKRLSDSGAIMFSSGMMPQQFDPLGRPMRPDGEGKNGMNSDVEIPSEARRKWVEDVLNELRSRASERGRSSEELEYYQRLLKRF